MASGTIYIDTGGSTQQSGTSDTNGAIINGANGCSVTGTTVTLPNGTVLTGVATDGSQAIFINDATNSNAKIFWITASAGSGGATPTLTVSVAPTGSISNSLWAVGGRMVLTPANYELALRPGDVVQWNNSPASRASLFYQARVTGTAAGYVKVRGKAGSRPLAQVTNTSSVFNGNSITHSWFENLEMAQAGASGDVITSFTTSNLINVKISDGGGNGVAINGAQSIIGQCEFSGITGDGINGAASNLFIFGNYCHDNTGNGINFAAASNVTIVNNICDTNTGRGIYSSSASISIGTNSFIWGNTVFGNGNSGIEVVDADCGAILFNNICMNNGATTGAGAYNYEGVNGAIENVGIHGNNLFYQDSTTLAAGAANLFNLTANSTELTSDPLFTNATGGDFSLGSSSPAKATGFPGIFLGGSTGYLDMGAVQRQESGAGAASSAYTFAG